MAKTREIQCENYICQHQCKRGKDADFYGICQTCPFYVKKVGAKPARTDNRRSKMDKIMKKEKYV